MRPHKAHRAGKDAEMKKNESKKRRSSFSKKRPCYMADDGTAYFYEWLNPETNRYERIPLTVGRDGITEEIILLLDSMDHAEDLNNRYEDDLKDPDFEMERDAYERNPCGMDIGGDPFAKIIREENDPANIVCKEKQETQENPDITRVREIINTKCNVRQQDLFFAHFGEGKQLEQIRQEEVAATGKEKSRQAILNVKNDVIRKVAKAYGVTPAKRRKATKV